MYWPNKTEILCCHCTYKCTSDYIYIYTWEYFCAKPIIALPVGRTD